jgi:beta-lactamase superfamily II metal-dependent hydrolase
MKKLFLFFFIFNAINIINASTIEDKEIIQLNSNENKNMVHFIKCGSADSILIESNGKFGLVDTSNPYKYIENEVEPVQIDETIGERHQWVENPNESVQAVLNYLDYLKVDKLDFILGTHAHSDHIGGVPAVAYNFVDNNTKYYYRKYRMTKEDFTDIDWANYKYYLAAVNSMEKKGAELIDVTDQNIKFEFGDFKIELLNTDIDLLELFLGENHNSIVTLVKFENIKLVLAADMISKDDKKIKDYLGKIDILKLAHHGYSESSYEFISTTKPDYVVISNYYIPDYANQIINYLKDVQNTKVYLTQNVVGTTEIIGKSAIKLKFLKNENSFQFSNTGGEVTINKNLNGWFSWGDKWTYLVKGKTLKGWQYLDWSRGKSWFYFDDGGIMVTGWQELNWRGGYNWFYFDKKNGNMLTGWQTLNWSRGKDIFYFMPDNGTMAQNTCINIKNKNYCFDENGALK